MRVRRKACEPVSAEAGSVGGARECRESGYYTFTVGYKDSTGGWGLWHPIAASIDVLLEPASRNRITAGSSWTRE